MSALDEHILTGNLCPIERFMAFATTQLTNKGLNKPMKIMFED